MSDESTNDESTNTSNDSGGRARPMVLIGILVIALIGLAYDYQVARPSVELAYDKIVERSAEVNARSTEVFTNLDVRELIGKEPSETFSDANGDIVEVFSWRSGLPIKTHDLFTVYKPSGDKKMFYRHAKYKYATSKEVSVFSVPFVIEGGAGSDEEDGQYEAEMAEADDAEGGGGRPGGGGGGGFDPEAIFAERDADGDGFWKGDEISERARENLADMDTDADGAVSKEEWMVRIQARRGGGGGRGGRGGGGAGGGDQSRQRPELETDDEPAESKASEPEAGAENPEAKTEQEAEAPDPEAGEGDE